jgi:acetolactate decarboxylase
MGKLFQASTMLALLNGNFDYTISIEYFMKNGNTGLGSYNGLNGEAIFLNGIAYNATASGNVKIMDIPQTGVTFGQISRFEEDASIPSIAVAAYASKKDLDEKLNAVLPRGINYFYMIKAEGAFKKISVRSPYKQRKPFRPMSLVLKEMKSFTYENIEGTLVGVFTPSYADGLSARGWHLHFLSKDLTKGGHVTDLSGEGLSVKVNLLDKYEVKLPSSKDYITQDFSKPLEDAYQGYFAPAAPTEAAKPAEAPAPTAPAEEAKQQ